MHKCLFMYLSAVICGLEARKMFFFYFDENWQKEHWHLSAEFSLIFDHNWGFCTEIGLFLSLFAFLSLGFAFLFACSTFGRLCFSFCFLSLHDTHPPTLLVCSLVNLEYNELSKWLWCKKLPHCLLSCLCIFVSLSTMENVLKFRPGKMKKRKT